VNVDDILNYAYGCCEQVVETTVATSDYERGIISQAASIIEIIDDRREEKQGVTK